MVKKSKKANVRIGRAVKALRDANHTQIGNSLFEEIITRGIISMEKDLKKTDRTRNQIIGPGLVEEVIIIIEEHIQLTRNTKNGKI